MSIFFSTDKRNRYPRHININFHFKILLSGLKLRKKKNFIFLFVLLNTAMKEVGHALFLAIVLSIAREKASAEGNTAIERKEVKMSAFFRNINKGRRHYRIN